MIQKTDGKIGSREFFVLVFFAIAVELSDMTTTFLFKDGKTATWMIPIFSAAVLMIPFLVLMSIIKKFKNKGLTDVVYAILGKYFGFIVNMILFAIIFAALVLDSRNYVDIVQVMFFPRTPLIVIYIILMGSSYFIANRGLETIGRTSWACFQYIMASVGFLILMVLKDARPAYIFPLWGPGLGKLIKSAIENSSIVADIFLLTALFPYARSYKEFKVPVILGFIASVFVLSLFIFLYTAIYDYPPAENVTFPFQQLIMLAKIGRFLTSIEAFFFLFWVIAFILRFTIYLYLTVVTFGCTLHLNEFEPLLLPFSVITIILGLVPKNYIESVFVYRQSFLLGKSWAVFIFLPFLLWIVFKIRGEKVG